MTIASPDVAVHVRDLNKQYTVHEKEPGLLGSLKSFVNRKSRSVEAVRGVSFDLQPGEVVGFLGPNGAGKTTTLKMLSGLLHPSAGTARVVGFEPRRREAAFLKRITLVMGQKQQLLWDLPALDSFLVNQAIYEIPDDEYHATMREFTEVLDLGGILKKQVRKLSLGERMKCELAAALLHRPQVLFLDEPTIGLDVNMQEAVRAFVRDYNARFGATVMLTSHYMADVTALAQRILVIDRGELVFDGDLGALAEQGSGGKTIRVQLRQPASPEALAAYGQVVSAGGLSAELTVPRAEVSARAARLLADFDVADLTVEDPPIEAVMAELFGGQRAPAAPKVEVGV
ncbi:ABC-2 type transport system ATP-binding protein [Deinococcus metalli]|uniref:ABC transporter ATP-binding protein n=1 Tax=Deinococcus metalli TaxID=1141878 RepID=A0A7W8NSR3_9DEIO|nr:ATP-binding cassette domain-containing protein [Deinococcus metalli]MBB5378258.1 ABC-2 type transport system ATP-binding protein [Deinococcus metalli]GHF57229.1 ABC transporter ATP-binding protein [Deinococcus metalli]